MGIEPTRSAWKAEVLPLNYIRISTTYLVYYTIYIMSSKNLIKLQIFEIF